MNDRRKQMMDIPYIEARPANTSIIAENITKVFKTKRKETVAIENCNIEVLQNEFVCIVGASGCGKSTLLRMIAGLDFPTSGNIIVNDNRVKGPGIDRGMVFQGYTLFPWMSVEKNLRYGLKEKKLPKEDQNKIVDKYLDIIGLSKFRNAYPKQLSGGMKQRVAIARALANEPDFFLMDEPFGALDPITKARLQLFIRDLWKKQRATILFVTHDIEEAIFLSTKIYVMSSRPGKMKETVPVYLPYERTLDLKDTKEFYEYYKKIKILISEEKPSGQDARTAPLRC